MTTAWLYTVEQAKEFWDQLRQASVEILKAFGLPIDQGRKSYSKWKHGRPIGGTAHFTAGPAWKGSVRWLNEGGHGNSVSCQMLILDHMLLEAKVVYAKYSLLKDFKVVVILLSRGIDACWHAGWVNLLSFGVENRNAGPLRGTEGKWRWWAKGWKAKFPHVKMGKTPILIDGRWWEPYTVGQIWENIRVFQYLHALYQNYGGLDQRWFLPHSATTGTKWDTGRAYPLHTVRNAVFAQMPIEGIPWLKSYAADPTAYVLDMEEEEDKLFLMELEERYAESPQERKAGEIDWDDLQEMPDPGLQDLIQDGNWKQELDSVRKGLSLLGYVTGGAGSVLDEDTALAVYQFQKSVGCEPYDKIPGTKTQEAMYKRIKQFQLHKA